MCKIKSIRKKRKSIIKEFMKNLLRDFRKFIGM